MPNRKRWIGLLFISLGVSMIIVDATIVNVAIPNIFVDLRISTTQAQWIQEIYTLVFASLLLVFGRWADRFGRRKMFVIGILIFALSSVVAANVGSGDALITARLVQGIGGAMMLPTSLSLLNSTFFGKERGIAFAIWGSTIGASAALGPLLGGYLTTSQSWRWAFGINIPIGAIVLIGLLIFVKESRGENESGADYFGALLSVLGIGSIVFGLIEGRNYGWWSSLNQSFDLGGISIIPIMFILGLVLLSIFARTQIARSQKGQPVLFDVNLLRVGTFRNANIAAGIVSLGEFGLLFSLPLWLQNVLGYSAFGTGVILLSLAVGSILASGAGGALGAKRGPIFVVQLGIFLELLGVAGIALIISPTTKVILIIIPLFIYGLGVGLATAQLTGVALSQIPVEKSGQASGMTSTTRQIGSALGIAILGTVLFASFGSNLRDAVPDQRLSSAIVNSAGGAIEALSRDPKNNYIVEQSKEALTQGSRTSAYVASAFLLIGWFATRSLSRKESR